MKQYLSIISLIILIVLSNPSFSQDRGLLNELFARLDTVSNDTMRANIYHNIGIQYTMINPDSAEYYTIEAIKQYEKLNDPNQIVKATINLSAIYLKKSKPDKGYDVLLKLIQSQNKKGNNEQEILKQKEINKYNKLRLVQKQNENLLLIAGFVLVVFLLLFVSQRRKKDKKINAHLELKNNEILAKSKALNILNEHLVKLGKFKEAMTGMIVHDLKNPLNIIINSDNTVYSKHAGRHMLMMVQNILDIQKFEEAQLDINTKNESIYMLAQKAIKEVSLLIETKKINVSNNISIKFGVIADAEKTKRIFVNILTNAIKYTGNNGRITLDCDAFENKMLDKKDKSQRTYYKISVIDTGDGIPADKIDVIFDMFEQVSPRRSGEIHSTGIGLTYCKLAVEAQGGTIWVESEIDKGSSFWFTLPKGDDINNYRPVKEYKKEDIKLTNSDKKYLEPFFNELKELEVYDISEAEKILDKIESKKTKGITEWKSQMENTLFITDENIFTELLNC